MAVGYEKIFAWAEEISFGWLRREPLLAFGLTPLTFLVSWALVKRFAPAGWPQLSRQIALVTSGAAGLAAAFNTPLGGIVFVVEELTRIHLSRFRMAVFSAVIIAGLTAQQFLGSYLYL